ncbi:hypothetical protein MTR67_000528 [Solanum verrucosum]|uniref:Uncharacterized protein n=1 Tax=Solanum verrucosum TaxID=315347 RepID=A0AAF0PLT6_SOLVR|nr:hypothetical protein MTR67_000528 [Solanum verrucosum]
MPRSGSPSRATSWPVVKTTTRGKAREGAFNLWRPRPHGQSTGPWTTSRTTTNGVDHGSVYPWVVIVSNAKPQGISHGSLLPTCARCGKRHKGANAPKQNKLYALQARGEQECSPDVVTDFNVILGNDWLHSCYVSNDCRTRVVKFQFPNEPILEWKGEILCLEAKLGLSGNSRTREDSFGTLHEGPHGS